MYEQPALKKWGIFYTETDKRVAIQFMETMMKCTESFGYCVEKPREF
jgi:aubergine